MDLHSFTPFSLVHVITLAVCVAISAGFAIAGVRLRGRERSSRFLRGAVVAGCVVFWFLSGAFWFLEKPIPWESALPLQFCNLANLIGAAAVGWRLRVARSLLYFWTFALCIWAFLTPALHEGPATVWFWLFWGYHLFILVPVAWVLCVDRFRPSWDDFRQAVLLTLCYMALLAAVNHFTGWNYGFVGAGKPSQPSPVDVLGPYPLRLLWMVFIGLAVFAILMVPWLRRNKVSVSGD